MKKSPQQPGMDEWLLDSLQGLHEGDEEQDVHHLKSSNFINPEVYGFLLAINHNPGTHKLERKIRRVLAKSIWPRLLLIRTRALLEASLKFLDSGHLTAALELLNQARKALLCAGYLVHGLRIFLNNVALIYSLATDNDVDFFQKFEQLWFQIANDAHWFLAAFTPASEVALSITLLVLEVALIAIHGLVEINRLGTFKGLFETKLDKNLSQESQIELLNATGYANKMLDYKTKKMCLSLGTTLISISLYITKHFLIPSFFTIVGSHPATPLAFAVLSFIISLANHYMGKYLDENKPKIDLEEKRVKNKWSLGHNFFKTVPSTIDGDEQNAPKFLSL